MPINALRKPGAMMSLQEALERVEKLKRLMKSSNEHEAALAASRLKSFDINAARAPKKQGTPQEAEPVNTAPMCAEKTIEVLDAMPERPFKELSKLSISQDPQQTKVNWDELHFALLEEAKKIGADAIVDIQIQGTVRQKVLAGTAIKYLNSKDLYILHELTEADWDAEEQRRREEEKERRDEEMAPGIG